MEFLDKVNRFISSKQYANKGIRTKDGKLAYVTATGVTKPFSDGEGGPNCPTQFVDVDQTWQNLGFPVGSLMQNGQSCGNEGEYVRAEPPSTDFDWKFYLESNGDLGAAGITTEQQARDHWNNHGKAEGRVPNAFVFSTMEELGKVGYVDVDTQFHSVEPTYTNKYVSFLKRTNITGDIMNDCSEPPPFLKYGDTVVLKQNNKTAFLNGTSLQFGDQKTNLILRPPPGNDRTGIVIRSGDAVCISSSSSSYTNDCGWWGCKVAKINEQKQLEFSSGGQTPQQFNIFSKMVNPGQNIRMDHSFYFISIPLTNKANLPLNASVNCTAGVPDGRPAGVYRFAGLNTLNYYPTGEIASSWNPNWGSTRNIDCSTYKFGDTDVKNNQANLGIGDPVRCSTVTTTVEGFRVVEGFGNNWLKKLIEKAQRAAEEIRRKALEAEREAAEWWRRRNIFPPPAPPPRTYRQVTVPSGDSYRHVGENTLRVYPNATVGSKWDAAWNQGGAVNCTTYKFGPPMTNESDGVGIELIETPKYIYVSGDIAKAGDYIKIDLSKTVFTFQTPVYDNSCIIDKLKTTCNDNPKCIGFVQSPANHTWQMITPDSNSGDYKITSTIQDVYLKEATVDVGDDSCEPGPVSFISGTVLQQYPEGAAFKKGKGKGKCDIIKAPRGNVQNDVPKAKEMVDKFPNVQFSKEPTKEMKKKTAEYEDVLQKIKHTKPNVTLEQQYTDMQVFDEQNRTHLILWSVLSVTILGFVFFRMKS